MRAVAPSALLRLTAHAGCSESGLVLCSPEWASGAGAGLQPSVGRRGPRPPAAGTGGCARPARQLLLRATHAQHGRGSWPSQRWVQKHTTLAKPEMATIPRQLIIVEMHRGLASGVGRTRRDDGWVLVWWWCSSTARVLTGQLCVNRGSSRVLPVRWRCVPSSRWPDRLRALLERSLLSATQLYTAALSKWEDC